MPGRSRLPRLLLIVAGILVALVLVAWGAVTILLPPPKVRAIVQQQLAGALSREVKFDDASVSIFPPVRLNVTGVALAEPGGLAHGAAFQTAKLGLDLDVFSLFGGKIVVRRLVLDHPALHLLTRADGTTNLDGIVKTPPPGAAPQKPMDLDVRELRVLGGKVLLDDVKSARRTALDVDTKLAFSSSAQGKRVATSGTTKLSGLAWGPLSAARLSDLNTSLAKLEWKIDHDGKYDATLDRLALAKLGLGFGSTTIGLSGVVDHPGPKAVLALKAQGANVDLGQILGFLAAADAHALNGIGGSGRLDFDLGIRGGVAPGAIPAVTGTLAIANGRVKYASAPASIDGIGFHAKFGGSTLDVQDFAARVADQPVRAQLHVEDFADPRVNLALQGRLDLAAVGPMVAPKDTKLAGRADVNVRAQGRAKAPESMALQGGATLANVSVESPSLPKKLEGVNGALSFSQTRAEVKGLTGKAGQSSFLLDGTVDRPLALAAVQKEDGSFDVPPAGVNFDFRSPYLDLAEIMPQSGGAPVLPNARGTGKVRIDRLKNGALDVKNVLASVALEPAVLSSPQFSLDGYGGKVGGNAKFDLTHPKSPAFAVKAKVDTISADALLSAWTPAKGLLAGALSTDLDLSGAGSTPDQLKHTLTAVGLAAIANGQLGPGPIFDAIGATTKIPQLKAVKFRDGKLPFRVERGRVVTDPVKLSGPYGDWQVTGAVGFDGALDYAVSITMPQAVAAALNARSALAAGALSDAQGRLLLDLRVSGNAKSPRVAWDPRAMQARLMGKASEAIAEQRAKLEDQARQALAARQAEAADSARAALEKMKARAADSLKSRAGDALKGFFGGLGGKKKSEPSPAPSSTPASSDTTKGNP